MDWSSIERDVSRQTESIVSAYKANEADFYLSAAAVSPISSPIRSSSSSLYRHTSGDVAIAANESVQMQMLRTLSEDIRELKQNLKSVNAQQLAIEHHSIQKGFDTESLQRLMGTIAERIRQLEQETSAAVHAAEAASMQQDDYAVRIKRLEASVESVEGSCRALTTRTATKDAFSQLLSTVYQHVQEITRRIDAVQEQSAQSAAMCETFIDAITALNTTASNAATALNHSHNSSYTNSYSNSSNSSGMIGAEEQQQLQRSVNSSINVKALAALTLQSDRSQLMQILSDAVLQAVDDSVKQQMKTVVAKFNQSFIALVGDLQSHQQQQQQQQQQNVSTAAAVEEQAHSLQSLPLPPTQNATAAAASDVAALWSEITLLRADRQQLAQQISAQAAAIDQLTAATTDVNNDFGEKNDDEDDSSAAAADEQQQQQQQLSLREEFIRSREEHAQHLESLQRVQDALTEQCEELQVQSDTLENETRSLRAQLQQSQQEARAQEVGGIDLVNDKFSGFNDELQSLRGYLSDELEAMQSAFRVRILDFQTSQHEKFEQQQTEIQSTLTVLQQSVQANALTLEQRQKAATAATEATLGAALRAEQQTATADCLTAVQQLQHTMQQGADAAAATATAAAAALRSELRESQQSLRSDVETVSDDCRKLKKKFDSLELEISAQQQKVSSRVDSRIDDITALLQAKLLEKSEEISAVSRRCDAAVSCSQQQQTAAASELQQQLERTISTAVSALQSEQSAKEATLMENLDAFANELEAISSQQSQSSKLLQQQLEQLKSELQLAAAAQQDAIEQRFAAQQQLLQSAGDRIDNADACSESQQQLLLQVQSQLEQQIAALRVETNSSSAKSAADLHTMQSEFKDSVDKATVLLSERCDCLERDAAAASAAATARVDSIGASLGSLAQQQLELSTLQENQATECDQLAQRIVGLEAQLQQQIESSVAQLVESAQQSKQQQQAAVQELQYDVSLLSTRVELAEQQAQQQRRDLRAIRNSSNSGSSGSSSSTVPTSAVIAAAATTVAATGVTTSSANSGDDDSQYSDHVFIAASLEASNEF